MRILSLTLCFLFFIGCDQKEFDVYVESEKPNWHKIDLKNFELETPKEYQFQPHQGIDSFVGEISNGQVTFFFDYGWYSNKGPMTAKDLFEKYATRSFFDFLDDSIKNEIKVENIRRDMWKDLFIKNVIQKDSGQYVAEIQYKDRVISHPFDLFDQELEDNKKRYEFETFQDSLFYKKIYFPKNTENHNEAGAYLEDLIGKQKNSFQFNKLSFYTSNVNHTNQQEIIQILRSLKMKKKSK